MPTDLLAAPEPRLTLARLIDFIRRLAGRRPPRALGRLPLVEARAAEPGDTLCFVFSGDGNWAMLVRGMSHELARRGVACIGLRARTYFLRRRSPDEVTADVEAVLRHYLAAWGAGRVVLAGLSRGADVLPFVVRRLPRDLRRRVVLLALLSPARAANFRFRWADLLGHHERPDDAPLLPELRAIEDIPIVCVNGAKDAAALCPSLPPGIAECVTVHGGPQPRQGPSSRRGADPRADRTADVNASAT